MPKKRQACVLLLALVAIGAITQTATAQERVPDGLELVESAPIETTLDHPDIRNTDEVWLEMIAGARKTLDFAEFYVTDEPGSRLEPVVAAIEAAAVRGVRVRFLADAVFAVKYPETLDRIAKVTGVEVRRYDMKKATGGGVLHAKYFIADQRDAFLGSQNFDWRSLEHIQELGVRVRSEPIAQALLAAYENDWARAGGADQIVLPSGPFASACSITSGDAAPRVTPVFSPREGLGDLAWDLPGILAQIDRAERSVRVQLLTYQAASRREYFDEIESALRRAGARGVAVELLLADWCKRARTIEGLKSLSFAPNVTIKLVTIPPWSGGFIPYARVIHAKYMVVDALHAWIGTSNWEKDYFYESRNVGLIVEGAHFAAELERFFQDGWTSSYAQVLDPCTTYTPPRIGEEK